MEIEIGKHVMSSDGKQIGAVDRLVLDPDRDELVEIIVHKGLFLTSDRLIELGFVKCVGLDGIVHLNVTAEQSDELPLFVKQEYIVPHLAHESTGPSLILTGEENMLWSRAPREPHYGWYERERGVFDPVSFEPPEIEVRTNLPPGAMEIDRGAAVVGIDDAKLGAMTEVTVDEHGDITSIRAQTGIFGGHHEIDVPWALIKSTTHDRITLTVSAAEVEDLIVNPAADNVITLDIKQRAVSSDGQNVGRINRLIVNPKSMEIQEFVIREGRLRTQDRFVHPAQIERTSSDGTIHLSITAAETQALPPFIRERYVVPSPERFHAFSSEGWAGSTIVDPEVLGPVYTGEKAHFAQAGSISKDAVVLSEQTEVHDASGDEIGVIDEVLFTPEGVVTAFIVRAGRIFHHDVRIPVAWIESMRHDRIELGVTKEICGCCGTDD